MQNRLAKIQSWMWVLILIFGLAPQTFSQEQETARPQAEEMKSSPPASGDFEAAMRLYRQKRYSEAIAAFDQITQSDPKNAAAYYFSGYAHYVQGHRPEALTAFAKAFEVNPSFDPRPYFR